MSWILRCTGAALAAGLGASAAAVELQLDGDRMSLRTRNDSLRDVLAEFVRIGVEVSLEPEIEATVNGSLEDVSIKEGLDGLLESYNYVLYWQRLNGPAGAMDRLAGLHVFRPGHLEDVIAFDPVGDDFHVVRMAGVPPHVQDEILLGLRPGTNARQFRELLASIGGTVVSTIPSFGIYQVRLPRGTHVPALAETLGNHPYVAVVEPNYVQKVPTPTPLENPAAPSVPSPPTAPSAAPGSSAVAVFDSGLLDLDALEGAVVGSYDSVKPGRDMADPIGHGTQMALVAAGAVLPGGGVDLGDGTPVLAVRAFDDNGIASNFSLLRGIDYTIEQGGRVLSLSWGSYTDSEFLSFAVGYARERNLVVVASAGNEPLGKPVYPAAYPGVVAVAAMLSDGSLWPKSNYGSFLSAAAPGTADFPVGHNGPPGSYVGTSISSPYVARAFGQYFDQHPKASTEDALAAFTRALTDAGDPGKDDRYGYGAFDADALNRFLAP